MLTIKEYNNLSIGRKNYIKKQAKKRGLSIDDYLVKNNAPQIDPVSISVVNKWAEDQGMGKVKDVNLDNIIDGFQPDFGAKCKKINKSKYEMNMMHFAGEILQAGFNKIPHRYNELTCSVPYDGKMYCATFKWNEQHRKKIADAMRLGHMGFTIEFALSGKIQTMHEWIRLIKIKKIIPSKEVYDVGGNFSVSFLGHPPFTFKQIAESVEQVNLVNVA